MTNKTLRTLGAGGAVSDADLLYTRQGADTVDKSITASQIKAYLRASISATSPISYNSATGSISAQNLLLHSLSSGLIDGAVMSVNGSNPARFDITAGRGVIVDNWTDVDAPTITNVTINAATSIVITNIATADSTYILISNAGAIVQQTAVPTEAQRRTHIFLGRIAHTNRTSIGAISNQPDVLVSPVSQLRDLEEAIGTINMGVKITPNGANLQLNRTAGELYRNGSNLAASPLNPSVSTITAQTGLTFRMRTQTGQGVSTSTNLDVANYDVGGTVTPITGNKFTNFRVFQLLTGNTVIQYGQNVYNSMSDAIAAINSQTFVLFQNLVIDAVMIGVITASSNSTDLSDTAQAKFTPASKFGEVTGAATSGSAAAGGASAQIQFNNGGSFDGADNARIENENLTLTTQTNPPAPTAGNVSLVGRSIGGRVFPAFKSVDAVTELQSSLATKDFLIVKSAGNSAANTVLGASATTNLGTATAANVSTSNVHTQTRRTDYLVTTPSTTAVAGVRHNAAQWWLAKPYLCSMVWGPATGVSVATNRAFAGMRVASAPTDVEPSTLTDMFGMGWDAADTNIQFMHNDASGTAIKIDLGASFPVPTVDRTNMYELQTYANTSGISYRVVNYTNGAVASGTVNTNIPSTTTLLAPSMHISVGGTSSVIGIALSKIYLESEY